MLWFNKDKQKKMDFIQSYLPTSKAQLLQVAMWYHKGDTQKAQDFVDFYLKNLPDLPETDPATPTFLQQVKGSASELYAWLKANQSDLVQGYQFIQSLIKNRGELVLPAQPPAQPLPPINE